tara:strand:+ start:212 stop:316 length:105 start_codon:yes stop_codon:yes gene_type:complete
MRTFCKSNAYAISSRKELNALHKTIYINNLNRIN